MPEPATQLGRAARPRRVLMTGDAVGGVWGYALDLARELAAEGVQTALAIMGPPPDDQQREDAEAVPGLTVQARPFKLEWMRDPWQDVDAAGEWLLGLEAQTAPDVVHLNGYAHAALPWRAPTMVVAHSCVLSWWAAVRGGEAPGEWDTYRERVGDGLAAADLVVAPSAWMAEAVARHHGPLGGVQVIHNGRDPARFPPGPKQPVVLTAGRIWDEAKNTIAMTRVAGRLPWPVRIAGEAAGPWGTRAEDGGVDVVQWLGRLSQRQMAQALADAAIYAHPARYEPFGLAPLEAALAGAALVLGDIPSLREIWGDSAVYADPEDDAALEAALKMLIGDKRRLRALADAARERALGMTAREMARSTLAAYAALLGRRGDSSSELAGGTGKESPACAS